MEKSLEILVSGMVQGIGYRAFAVRNARLLQIRGSAQNLYDGRVRIVAFGEESKLKAYLDLLRIGPAYASVNRIDVQDFRGEVNYEDFIIEY